MSISPELTEEDAINMIIKYYGKKFDTENINTLLALLIKIDIPGLVAYAFNAGVLDVE